MSDSTKKRNRDLSARIIDAVSHFLSRFLHLFTGVNHACRFQPTCRRYALLAVEKHGFFYGGWLSIQRVLRCHPWGNWGIDPVPGERK